ncbi:hypothetical protein Ahy_B02g058072 [Arachis hypogaea]|uniref:Uncharacterized protein n=1 Tax=Arachis hypogaea TaxID=3818 RepID=A0A445ADR9_ARAHY|nr:hypothetical protein Ahy_B02g058072 [Arachis hypogaea]
MTPRERETSKKRFKPPLLQYPWCFSDGNVYDGKRRKRKGRLDFTFEVTSLPSFPVSLILALPNPLEFKNRMVFVASTSIFIGYKSKKLAKKNQTVPELDRDSLPKGSCSITGSIPESIGGLILLKSALLSGNSLTGLEMLSNLSVLDLSGNE